MARVTFVTAFGHQLGPHQRLTSVLVPYRRIAPPISFNLAFVSVSVALLVLELLRCGFADHAPKGEAMARVTFATAFEHPLGPHQSQTSAFVPYHRAMAPVSFNFAFDCSFACWQMNSAFSRKEIGGNEEWREMGRCSRTGLDPFDEEGKFPLSASSGTFERAGTGSMSCFLRKISYPFYLLYDRDSSLHPLRGLRWSGRARKRGTGTNLNARCGRRTPAEERYFHPRRT